MLNLKDKTILLLAPNFFGYEFEIKKELENFDANVIYFDERPKNDFFTKVFLRLNIKFFIQKRIDSYYKNILNHTKNIEINYLLLINPETINLDILKQIKDNHKNIKIFTYFWDSIRNKKNALDYLNISDKYFTFDSNDIRIDEKINFLPLFYIKDYENIANLRNDFIYDIAFIGTIHSDRYKIIKIIEKQLKQYNLKTFFYFYSPSKILFFFQKLFKKDFKLIKWSDVSFQSLDRMKVVDIIKKSKAVIDIQHPLQSGLTMRTLEMVGAKRKLFTTNENSKKYSFFDENNIFIFNRDNIEINIEFLQSEFAEINQVYYESYSLRKWIETIFKI